MSRHITVIQSDEACGWYVIEDGRITGGLSTDEAMAHVMARMLGSWAGFPREPLEDVAGALYERRVRRAEENAAEATA